MYRLQIRQLVVVRVDAHAKEQPRVPPVHYLQRAKLDEVGLVLLIARGDEAVDLGWWRVWLVGRVGILGQRGQGVLRL